MLSPLSIASSLNWIAGHFPRCVFGACCLVWFLFGLLLCVLSFCLLCCCNVQVPYQFTFVAPNQKAAMCMQ